jgi:hypothetical protein
MIVGKPDILLDAIQNSSCDAKGKPYKWNPRRGKVPMHMKGADHPVLVLKLV